MPVRPLEPSLDDAALEFLAREPYDNVFLYWSINTDRSRASHSAMHAYIESGEVHGVAFFGRQTVIAADRDDAVDAFAEAARMRHVDRMLVSPRAVVERFWSGVQSWHRPPRIVRESQPVFALDRARLTSPAASQRVRVRRAHPGEWRTVTANSAEMIEHELGYDPRASMGDYAAGVRLMIERGLWWVGEYDGELCFFCNLGPRSPQTLQLQGIWTPPHLRGRGLATQALHALCVELPDAVPSFSLYVNDFNAAAIALYERIGFQRVGEFRTLLF